MDPDETLRLLRKALAAYRQKSDAGKPCEDEAAQLADHAEALLGWMDGGGRLPRQWD